MIVGLISSDRPARPLLQIALTNENALRCRSGIFAPALTQDVARQAVLMPIDTTGPSDFRPAPQ
jgi:hypothetical protein